MHTWESELVVVRLALNLATECPARTEQEAGPQSQFGCFEEKNSVACNKNETLVHQSSSP